MEKSLEDILVLQTAQVVLVDQLHRHLHPFQELQQCPLLLFLPVIDKANRSVAIPRTVAHRWACRAGVSRRSTLTSITLIVSKEVSLCIQESS